MNYSWIAGWLDRAHVESPRAAERLQRGAAPAARGRARRGSRRALSRGAAHGAGRAFCAGQDLGDRVDAGADLGATIEAYYNPLIRRIRRLRKPVVCAFNGVAAGAGRQHRAGL